MKILLSAFACDPTQGSESGYGWNWATGIAKAGIEVHCITRDVGRANIEAYPKPSNVTFYYIKLPFGLEKLYSFSIPTMYLYYLLWQWRAYKKGKSLNGKNKFSIVHHVTWGSYQLGSFMYLLPVKFIFGPAGGGQISPLKFKKYFGKHWRTEVVRNIISKVLQKYNPGFNKMVKCASVVWVSNNETYEMVNNLNPKSIKFTLDAALASNFIPSTIKTKTYSDSSLQLLWVGRFMPRKGGLLIIEIMEKIREFKDITLTIVGDGSQRDEIINSIKSKGLEKSVYLVGRVPYEEVKKYYGSHDAFLFTSLRDSCPAQLVEAMAFGLPIITLDLHGQSVIVNEETGFRCNCDSPEQAIINASDAIIKLYYDRSLLKKMSLAARKFAEQQSWDNKIDKIIKESY